MSIWLCDSSVHAEHAWEALSRSWDAPRVPGSVRSLKFCRHPPQGPRPGGLSQTLQPAQIVGAHSLALLRVHQSRWKHILWTDSDWDVFGFCRGIQPCWAAIENSVSPLSCVPNDEEFRPSSHMCVSLAFRRVPRPREGARPHHTR